MSVLITKWSNKKMTTKTILPELVGTLTTLPEHIQKAIQAYGAACARVTLQSHEIQELRKDAKRYRWLRDQCEKQIGGLTICEVGPFDLTPWCGDDPDHHIDAAILKEV
jgi:hypothetical protein